MRAVATAALGDERGAEIALVERASGRAILDTTRGVLAWEAGPQAAYQRLASSALDNGAFSARWQPPRYLA